jgi:hypothetical protein
MLNNVYNTSPTTITEKRRTEGRHLGSEETTSSREAGRCGLLYGSRERKGDYWGSHSKPYHIHIPHLWSTERELLFSFSIPPIRHFFIRYLTLEFFWGVPSDAAFSGCERGVRPERVGGRCFGVLIYCRLLFRY